MQNSSHSYITVTVEIMFLSSIYLGLHLPTFCTILSEPSTINSIASLGGHQILVEWIILGIDHWLLSSSEKGILDQNLFMGAEKMFPFLVFMKMGAGDTRLRKQEEWVLVSIPPQLEMFPLEFSPTTDLESHGHGFLLLSLSLQPSILIVLHFPPFTMEARIFSFLPPNYLDPCCQCVLFLCNTWLSQTRRI